MMDLIFAPAVIVTPTILRTAQLLSPYFNTKHIVTSGHRDKYQQLKILEDKVVKHGVDKLYSEYGLFLGSAPDIKVQIDNLGLHYWWQRPWSKVLSIGDVINPPLEAEVLFDYFRPPHPPMHCRDPLCEAQHNKKGRVIPVSNHSSGNAFDIGGGDDLKAVADAISKAYLDGNCFIHGFLVEKVNNAVHVDCVPA